MEEEGNLINIAMLINAPVEYVELCETRDSEII